MQLLPFSTIIAAVALAVSAAASPAASPTVPLADCAGSAQDPLGFASPSCLPYGTSCTPAWLNPTPCCPGVKCYLIVLGLGGWCWLCTTIAAIALAASAISPAAPTATSAQGPLGFTFADCIAYGHSFQPYYGHGKHCCSGLTCIPIRSFSESGGAGEYRPRAAANDARTSG
ncbi:hypothetical protein A0H81_12612 [Grifola frondosa]|uniref:Uncharacterized protein n=1 Tax=Grifola frondosa TaxID=5627 RepID=A0A1C7LR45_GRIFR|nr:hypothetical protein A0H81_12612 [Grifola frondosa]